MIQRASWLTVAASSRFSFPLLAVVRLTIDRIPGIEMLKDPCLTHTVTGGEVIDCMVTWLVQGKDETTTKITGCLMIGGNGSDYIVGVEDVARNG